MRAEKITAERLTTFSDGVFAVIMTVMVLELKAPDRAAFTALWPLWPTAISYAVSYLFVVIIWINHHHLMRFVGPPTLRLMWINFVHLFLVSFLPFATAWVAGTRLGSAPVVFTQGSSCASTLPTTSSSTKYWPTRTPHRCPRVCGTSRGGGRSWSWRASRSLCWLRSLRSASASV